MATKMRGIMSPVPVSMAAAEPVGVVSIGDLSHVSAAPPNS